MAFQQDWPDGTGCGQRRKGDLTASQPVRCSAEPVAQITGILWIRPEPAVGFGVAEFKLTQQAIDAIAAVHLPVALGLAQPAPDHRVAVGIFLQLDPFAEADRFAMANAAQDVLQA